MLQFATGFFVCLLLIVFIGWFWLKIAASREKSARNFSDKGIFREQYLLVGQLAHEIKNPLSTIKINLKLIGEDIEELKRRQHPASDNALRFDEQVLNKAVKKVSVVNKEADRLEHILDDFLRYADNIRLQPENTDLNSLVGNMIDFYSPQGYSHSIVIRQQLFPGQLLCKIDGNLLKQTLLNLFLNAQQAMENGGELMIRTDKEGNYAVIRISDTGAGIAPDNIGRIFNGFSFRPGGRGLGLPMAKKIIEAHDGIITVESVQGKGTSFTIKLPLQSKT